MASPRPLSHLLSRPLSGPLSGPHSGRHGRPRVGAALACAGLVLLAACGSDEESSSTTAASTASTAATGASTATADSSGTPDASAPPSADAVAADDSLEPVVVGLHNLEGGAIDLPQIREGFEQGVAYVNAELGGINGHPLQIEACNVDVTPESSVNCANQFVEQNVVAAVQGVDVAADAALPILQEAGIAEIAFFAFSPGVNKAEGDAFITLFSNEEVYAADLIAQRELGSTKIAELFPDLPASHATYEEVVQPAADALGVDLTPFFYSPTQNDWTTYAATVLAVDPDGISMVAPSEADCTAAVAAFKAAGFEGTLHAGSCTEMRQTLDPDVLDGVINHNNYYEATMNDVPAKPAADLAVYKRYMETNAPDAYNTVYGTLGFSLAVDVAGMLSQVDGDLTAETVKAALPTVKGTKFFTESPYDCSTPSWPGTSACGTEVLFSRNTAEGTLEVLPFSPVDVSEIRPED